MSNDGTAAVLVGPAKSQVQTVSKRASRLLFDWDSLVLASLADGASVHVLADSSGNGVTLYGNDAARRPTKRTDSDGVTTLRFTATSGNGQRMVAEGLGSQFPALKTHKGPASLSLVIAPAELSAQPNSNPVVMRAAGSGTPTVSILSSGGVAFVSGPNGGTFTADTISGQPVLRNIVGAVYLGQPVSGPGIPANAYIDQVFGSSAVLAVPGTASPNATATATGVTISAVGFSNNGRQFMPSIADGRKHFLDIDSDGITTNLFVDGYLVSTMSGSFFAGGFTAPSVGVGNSTTGTGAAFFSGDIYRIAAYEGHRNAVDILDDLRASNAKYKGGLEIHDNTAAGVFLPQDSSTSDGSNVRVFVPPLPAADPVLVIWCHPSGGDRSISLSYFAGPYMLASLGLGWYFAASDMGFAAAPGGQTRTWGNSVAQNALVLLRDKVFADYGLPATTKIVLLGASMGGLASMNAIARDTLGAGAVKAVYLVDPALSLLDMYRTPYFSEIDAAYSVVSSTLSAAASAGATSLQSSGNYVAGTILAVGGGTAAAELVIVGPGGSSGGTIPITTGLVNAQPAGVRLSDFGSKTTGFDPMRAASSLFQDLPVRYTASSADALVPVVPNAAAMQSKLAGVARDNVLVPHLLGHLSGGATNPRDFVDFVRRSGVR